MKTRISALMDGELDQARGRRDAAGPAPQRYLAQRMARWPLIGAALRGERGLDLDVTARVMSALEAEPTVMAPNPGALRRGSGRCWRWPHRRQALR
jgi:sigma-E factor negative regulatory protein RseA